MRLKNTETQSINHISSKPANKSYKNTNDGSYAFRNLLVTISVLDQGGMEMLKHFTVKESLCDVVLCHGLEASAFAAHLLSGLGEWHSDKRGT